MTELDLRLLGYFLFELFESSNPCDHVTEIFLSHGRFDIFVWKNFFLLLEFFRFPIPVSLRVVICIFIIIACDVHIIVIRCSCFFMCLVLFLRFYELVVLSLGFFEDSLLTLVSYLRLYFLDDFFNVLSLFYTLIILDLELLNRPLSAYGLKCFDDKLC